uniref:Pectinesterase inhibitor domain-containing protein n=1 Tax=Quercus lobata TaxID=97700 RepID=A0A7N2LA52_QUELO
MKRYFFLVGLLGSGCGIRRVPDSIEITHKSVQSKAATKLAHQQGKSREMDVCIAKFEDSIDILKKSLKSLEDRDLPGLNVNLLAAMNGYVACDDAFSESKVINPIDKIDAFLCEMAVNSINLSGYIH